MQGEALMWKMKHEDHIQMQQTLEEGDVHGEEAHIATVKAQLQAAEEIQEKLQARVVNKSMAICDEMAVCLADAVSMAFGTRVLTCLVVVKQMSRYDELKFIHACACLLCLSLAYPQHALTCWHTQDGAQ